MPRETIEVEQDPPRYGKGKWGGDQLNTSNNAATSDDGLPVPLSVVRWICYAAIFFCLLIPFHLPAGQWICGALILGQFASQLNAIIKK
jgi:hypothetical protein